MPNFAGRILVFRPRVAFAIALLAAMGGAALSGCGGGGAYGFSREYEPLDDEEALLERSAPTSYEDVRRDPAAFRSQTLGWFGVVTAVEPGEGGTYRVAMTFRTHQPRHLCEDETSGSCRVTVSDRTSGPFSAVLTLRAEDVGAHENRVWVGSLLRVYGSPTGDFDAQGGPVLQGTWYRHWPRGYYRTTAARGGMRR